MSSVVEGKFPKQFLRREENQWKFFLAYHHKINLQMSQILAALLKLNSEMVSGSLSWHIHPVSLHYRPVYLSFCLYRYCTMDFIHCKESLSSLSLHVFFFSSWCVTHVRNTIQVLLSFCMTRFPLWKFKTSRSRSVLMVSIPAVLCLKCQCGTCHPAANLCS